MVSGHPKPLNSSMKHYPRPTRHSRGSILIESTFAFSVLTIVAMLLLSSTRNATTTQQWTVIQGMTDAYMTRELALAQRIPYDDFQASDSDWSLLPTLLPETVEIGKLPGGVPLVGTITRTRQPDEGNLTTAGGNTTTATNANGSVTANSNPFGLEAWKLQSFLTYTVGNDEYVKSRTTLRIR